MAMAAQLHIEWWSDTYNYTNNFYDFTDETTSTKEYEPGTCCRAVGMAAVLLSGRNQGLQIIASVSLVADIAGVP